MNPTISVVVPVRDGGTRLEQCLKRLQASRIRPLELIVVDDGSKDDSAERARRLGARVLATDEPSGPARARNLGARAARGDILLFVDADVLVRRDTTSRVRAAFTREHELDALIGSYDDQPSEPNFVSQYKNLLHCFVHQNGRREASTFWSGCGAIRRSVFLALGGFDERYRRPAIEDIELGSRLRSAGRRIVLEPELRVKHLKRWSLPLLIRSDIFDRALPWTELILRERHMPDDLNLERGQRLGVALALAFPLLAAAAMLTPSRAAALTCAGLAFAAFLGGLAVDARFYRFLAARRGRGFALSAVPLHTLYHFYSGAAFGAGILLHTLRLPFANREPRLRLPLESDPEPPIAALPRRR